MFEACRVESYVSACQKDEKDCQEEHQDSEDQAYSVPRLHNDLPTVAKGIMPLECPVSFGLDGLATRTGPTHDG